MFNAGAYVVVLVSVEEKVDSVVHEHFFQTVSANDNRRSMFIMSIKQQMNRNI